MRHRGQTKVLLTAAGIVIVGAVFGVVQLMANLGYDDALARFETVAATATSERAELRAELSTTQETVAAASVVLDVNGRLLLDTTSRDALSVTVTDAEAVTNTAQASAAKKFPVAEPKPSWAWELLGETTELDGDGAALDDLVDDLAAGVVELNAAETAVQDAGDVAVESAANAATAFEAAHISARNLDIIALLDAAESVRSADAFDAHAATSYAALEAAAAAMLASEQAELAEKAGPLQGARFEIEAFARDLAPGVLLDFDWSAQVNDYGYDGSMGGYATWWYHDPGYATIELTNSVAEQWPSDRSKALIAHEVGHAISVKCEGVYDDDSEAAIEAWATAWAISMGFTDDANGTWAYGAPPQSLIDTAATCR